MDSPPLTRRGPPDEAPAEPEQVRQLAYNNSGGDGTNSDSDYTDSDADMSGSDDGDCTEPEPSRRVPSLGLGPAAALNGNKPPRAMVPELNLGGLAIQSRMQSRDSTSVYDNTRDQSIQDAESDEDADLGSPDRSFGMPSSNASGPKLQLSLQLPRSPVDRAHGAQRGGDTISAASNSGKVVSIDLLSFGFQIELPQLEGTPSRLGPGANSGMLDVLTKRCIESLGVSPSDLSFYEIRKIEGNEDLPASCRNVAVAVHGSGETLDAYSDLHSNACR